MASFRLALQEMTRERVPLQWAKTQMHLGVALARIGEREMGVIYLVEASVAYRLALEERTRERVPWDWAETQNNLGKVLMTLGKREVGVGFLEDAVTAWESCLALIDGAWPPERVEEVRKSRDETQAEINGAHPNDIWLRLTGTGMINGSALEVIRPLLFAFSSSFCHSYRPVVVTRHRRLAKGSR